MTAKMLRKPHKIFNAAPQKVRAIVSSAFLPPNEPPTDLTSDHVREQISSEIEKARETCEDVPIVIGGTEYKTDIVKYQVVPHNHAHKFAKFYYADKGLIEKAIENALISREKWENMSYDSRSRIILRAASLVATKYRYETLALCILGQSKTAQQADIDAVAELIDFLKFNVVYGQDIHNSPPLNQTDNVLNSVTWRGLEGFVAAVSPFNFSAIGGNLASAPALMGNVVLWKPSDTAIRSNYSFYKIMQEAGIPDGVIQFMPADGPTFGDVITSHPELAGVTFTGSSKTFQTIWKNVGDNVGQYRTFPKLVGECGGKNYHFVHKTGEIDSVVNGTIRSSYEYQGQKCSACSRLYVPESLWPELKEKIVTEMAKLKMGAAEDFTSFLSAVIDQTSFNKIKSYIDYAKSSGDYSILAGGTCDDSYGYFVEPTFIQTSDPSGKLMSEEIFGPVCTAYVYPDDKAEETLSLANKTSPYGLTGSVFARDRSFIEKAQKVLRHSAGNFYINDRSTGSVVGQQPFGGARGSGTNDKAGMASFLQKWVSPQAIKETFVPLTDWTYPYMNK